MFAISKKSMFSQFVCFFLCGIFGIIDLWGKFWTQIIWLAEQQLYRFAKSLFLNRLNNQNDYQKRN